MEAFSAADDSFELEARRKEDSSWHPCRVSLSSSGDSLVVNFGSQELEDVLLKKDEVLMHLRYRSLPLQADDCCHIEEGESVLANQKSHSKDLFHDAEVEKVDRVRHSKRGCRCSFTIKWLDNDLEGQTLIVPSSSIRKLSTENISAHPIVHSLLEPEKDTGLSYSSPLLTILEDTDVEIDLNKLLQKQIEHISKLADASDKEFPEDILWRTKVLNKAQTPHKPTAESNARVQAVPAHNPLKRITRSTKKLQVCIEAKDQSGPMSTKKLQVDIEAKGQSGPTTSMQEEFNKNRSPLSPLAARAALASSLLTAKKCFGMDFSSCMTANTFMKDNHSPEILDISIPLVAEASHAISPLISTQGDASRKPFSYVPTKVWENEKRTSEKIKSDPQHRTFAPANVIAENVNSGVANFTAEAMPTELASARDKKPPLLAHFNASSTAPIRVTRSAMRKGAVISNECIRVKIGTDETKRRMSGNKHRLNHSVVCQENENLADEEDRNFTPANVIAENVTAGVANFTAETMHVELAIARDKKPSVLAHFNASSTAPIRVTRSAMRKEAVISNECIQAKICTDETKRRISGNKHRLNHSAVCQENENLANEEDRTFAPANVIAENVTSEVVNYAAETMPEELAIARDIKPSVLSHFNASSTASMRVTRSAMQKGAVISNECIPVKICTDDRRISGNKHRPNQSAVCQENEKLANEEENKSIRIIDSDSLKWNTTISESNVTMTNGTTSKKTKAVYAPTEAAESGKSKQGQKRKAVYPDKQERRFSPRIRSQNISQPRK